MILMTLPPSGIATNVDDAVLPENQKVSESEKEAMWCILSLTHDLGIALQDIRAALQAGAIFAMVSQAETTDGKDPTSLSEARQLALGILKQRWRAVTAGDFETLAKSITTCKVARAKCLPEKDLTAADPDTHRILRVSDAGNTCTLVSP